MKTINQFIKEGLKINSKSKINTELKTLNDFCNKYNCEFHYDSTADDTKFFYLTSDNNKLTKQIEHLLNLSPQNFKELMNESIDSIKSLNRYNYSFNARRNQDSRIIMIDCLNEEKRVLCMVTLGLSNNCLSEAINTKLDPEKSEELILKIIDFLLNI